MAGLAGNPEEEGLPSPRRYWAALAIWLATAMAVLDGAIANVALPTIAGDLHSAPALSIWVINAYQLIITVLLLPLAALGDRIGYRKVYLPGLAIFAAGSLLCALSGSLYALIAARIVQGTGAAAVMAINPALVRATYPARLLGRGLGYNALVLSISAAIGPTLAAGILHVASWPWLFAINLPVGMLALAIASKSLPATLRSGRPPDYPAALLSAIAMGCLVFGGESAARGDAEVGVPMMVLGIAAGTLLIRRERDKAAPLFPVDLLRIPIFSLSIGTSITSFAAQMLAFVTLPFYLQQVLGRSVVDSGLLMTPWPLAIGCAAPIAGRLADRYPAGILGGAGLALLTAGLLALSLLQPGATTADIVWRMALCGLGFGFFQSPNNRTIITAAPRTRSGAAGGMLATARLLGQTVGAVSVAAGFHWKGVQASSALLQAASAAALVAAVLSLLRMRAASSSHTRQQVVQETS